MRKLSRADRFAFAVSKMEEAKDAVASLIDELQDWLENMPDNLRESEKAESLQEAIDNLETIQTCLDEASTTDVDFPGMI